MGWGAAVGAVGGLLGGLGGAAISSHQAKKQRQWQEKMYDTRYVRTVKDLRNAGLNPILATALGGGTAGGGAMGQVGDLGGAMARGAEAGGEATLRKGQKGKLGAEQQLLGETAQTQRTQQNLNAKLADTAVAQAASARSVEAWNNAQVQNLRFEFPGKSAESNFDATPYGQQLRGVKRATDVTGSGNFTARNVMLIFNALKGALSDPDKPAKSIRIGDQERGKMK